VKEADPAGLGVEQTEQTLAQDVTPLLGAVNLNDFVRLARLSRIERKPQGSTLVREGERSDALYAVGRGRVVVATSSRDDDVVAGGVKGRVYVAALTEGDFFGEFSFLTQSPRSATVEAASDAILLRIDDYLRRTGLCLSPNPLSSKNGCPTAFRNWSTSTRRPSGTSGMRPRPSTGIRS
jgi:CRP-like cAMP-binding protein